MAKKKIRKKTKAKAKAKKKIKKIAKKSAVKKTKSKKTTVVKAIGRITHYYGKIKVAVVKLTAPLQIGDTIEIIGGQATDFVQKIASLQKDHKPIKSAKKGFSVGMKVKKAVKQGYKIYKT